MAPNPEKGSKRTFCLRMKSTLTKRGVHIRTSGYRVIVSHLLVKIKKKNIYIFCGTSLFPKKNVENISIEARNNYLMLYPWSLRYIYKIG